MSDAPAERLQHIESEFQTDLAEAIDAKKLEEIRIKYLGKKSEFTEILRSLGNLSKEEKKEIGSKANILKNSIAERLQQKKTAIEASEESNKDIDITLPGIKDREGTYHPITQTLARINEIFISMGFRIAEGTEIETEFYNFEALNIPLDHPSRDAFDTFYVDLKEKYLLRSHTSNVQIHVMQKQKPPFQVIMPGRVYRPDAVDASHSFMFHQVEGLMVDTNVRFSDLKGTLSTFCRTMFGEDIKMRLRPHFFPFTEPSAEVDISCIICKGKGCRVCKGNGWLEILGAGVVNPKVFDSVGYDPAKYRGFAFGMGVERIAMLLYGIDDIRLFYENDIRFLKQFK